MKRTLSLLLASALLAGAALAGITTTPKDGDYVLHNADNSIPAGFTKDTARFKSKELCAAAVDAGAKAGALKPGVKCDTSVGFTFAQDCEGEPAPTISLVEATADGQKYWVIPTGIPEGKTPPEPSEANGWATMVYAYVKAATWPAGYPNCWVRGFVIEDEWEVNPNVPGTPFLQVKGQSPLKLAENSIEPMPTPDGFEAERKTPVQEAKRQALHLCYEDDVKPCPPLAPVASACGQQFCGVIG